MLSTICSKILMLRICSDNLNVRVPCSNTSACNNISLKGKTGRTYVALDSTAISSSRYGLWFSAAVKGYNLLIREPETENEDS